MNKKLLLALYDRSGLGAYMPVDYKGQELEVEEHWEKFAQLIVAECLGIVDDAERGGSNDIWDNAVKFIRRDLREHFGVEE